MITTDSLRLNARPSAHQQARSCCRTYAARSCRDEPRFSLELASKATPRDKDNNEKPSQTITDSAHWVARAHTADCIVH